MNDLKEENKKLKQLLGFALDNLRFNIPEPAEDSEYDFCIVCGEPEWKHAKNCRAIQWENEVKHYLK